MKGDTPMSSGELETQLINHLYRMGFDDLPSDVVDLCKMSILDSL